MKKNILLFIISISFISCAELLQIASQTSSTMPVTNAENVSGLKSSLDIGIEKAVGILGTENGFYNDAVLKLLLPIEAQPIIDNIKLIPGGQKLVDKAVLMLNRSAEDAVKEATPIFKTAIKNMSFTDVMGVLFGGENAATQYLRANTYNELKVAFAPKINESLAKPLLANVSTNDSWNLLTNGYNSVASSPIGSIAGLKKVDVNLVNYVTGKALDALFIKIAMEEKAIRTDPVARVSTLLKRVFSQVDKK